MGRMDQWTLLYDRPPYMTPRPEGPREYFFVLCISCGTPDMTPHIWPLGWSRTPKGGHIRGGVVVLGNGEGTTLPFLHRAAPLRHFWVGVSSLGQKERYFASKKTKVMLAQGSVFARVLGKSAKKIDTSNFLLQTTRFVMNEDSELNFVKFVFGGED